MAAFAGKRRLAKLHAGTTPTNLRAECEGNGHSKRRGPAAVSVDFCRGDRGERSNGLDNFLLGGCALWRSGIEATEFAGVVARNGDYLARNRQAGRDAVARPRAHVFRLL